VVSPTPPLTLAEHRGQVLKGVKACADPKQVRELLADVQIMLVGTGVSNTTQASFWQGISTELDLETQRSKLVLDEEAGRSLRNLIRAARTMIKRYQRLLAAADVPEKEATP
jgi:hypothetical protein